MMNDLMNEDLARAKLDERLGEAHLALARSL